MAVRHAADIPRIPVSAGTGTERQILIGSDVGPNFALRRFIMQPGGGMPRHTNLVEHEQYVLRGRATVVVGDVSHSVAADDVLYIPAGVPHSYQVDGDTPFEFLCVVPNADDRIEIVAADE